MLESNARFAEMGRLFGWKLERHQVPEFTPVYMGDGWWLLDNDFNKTPVPNNDIEYF
jgi:hypothetical protein